MRKATHTTGPWHRNIRADGKYPVIFAGRNTHVAAAKGHGDLPPEEIEANIDLIASAPELLEAAIEAEQALSDIVNAADNGQPYTADELAVFGSNAAGKLYAAIAKARGDV